VSPLAKEKSSLFGEGEKKVKTEKEERERKVSLGEGKRPSVPSVCYFWHDNFDFSRRYSHLPLYAFFFEREREKVLLLTHHTRSFSPLKRKHQTERHRHATNTPAFCAAMHRVVKHRERAFGATEETSLRRSLLCASRGEEQRRVVQPPTHRYPIRRVQLPGHSIDARDLRHLQRQKRTSIHRFIS